jgi:hypothetical protein
VAKKSSGKDTPASSMPILTPQVIVEFSASLSSTTGTDQTADATLSAVFDNNNILTGNIALGNLSATTVTVRTGFAGQAGTLLKTLSMDSANAWRISRIPIDQALADQLAAGGVYVQVETDVNSWSANEAALGASGVAAFQAGSLYINVHTPANPGGELRGQVTPAGVQVVFSMLDGGQEVPTVVTTAAGIGAVTFNSNNNALQVNVNTSGVDDAVAAHIHRAAVGVNGAVQITLVQSLTDVSL